LVTSEGCVAGDAARSSAMRDVATISGTVEP